MGTVRLPVSGLEFELRSPAGADEMLLEHRGLTCRVRQHFLGEHVFSIHAPGADWDVVWSVEE